MPLLNVNGRPLHYVETGGGGPPLVLVHGAGGSATVWVRQLEGLADATRVIALDLPGHGASPGDGHRVVAEYAAAVRDFLLGLGAGPVILCGHSMGGAITQTVALTASELLRGVVLVGTGAKLRVFPRLFELMERDYGDGVAFVTQYAWSPASPTSLRESGSRAMLETPSAVTLGDFLSCDAFDVMTRVGAIRLPTLVIVGEDDQLTPPKYAEFLADNIPGSALVRIPQAGHYVQLEQPDEVNRAMREFLRTLP
jgi:pimeloyl-ACP methyl ester carboxylesterase